MSQYLQPDLKTMSCPEDFTVHAVLLEIHVDYVIPLIRFRRGDFTIWPCTREQLAEFIKSIWKCMPDVPEMTGRQM